MRTKLAYFGFAAFAVSQPAAANADEQFGTVGYYAVYSMPNSCRLTTAGDFAAFSVFYPFINGDNSVQFFLTHNDWESLKEGGKALNISIKHGPAQLPGSWMKTENHGFRYGPVPFEHFFNREREYSFTLEFYLNSRLIFETDSDPDFGQALLMLRNCRLAGLGVNAKDPFADPNSRGF
ncbi:MAG: hypothetical protein U0989_19970 [Azonexus sp.]|nr:hypothetical protein [Azonexus sp.]